MTAPDADGWIEWSGGRCPVAGNKLVEIKVRTDGIIGGPSPANSWSAKWWRHDAGMFGNNYDIIAYRIVEPRP